MLRKIDLSFLEFIWLKLGLSILEEVKLGMLVLSLSDHVPYSKGTEKRDHSSSKIILKQSDKDFVLLALDWGNIILGCC